ncbi:MAG: response regulator [Anaerolineae bacterium]|jgi:putative two-component system response regulator|nr:response regulator [Anaerolineae bacterium]
MAKRILIVDDDPLLCSLLKMTLVREGYQTDTVYSGQAALDYLAGRTVDLVLLDIMMADLNGFDVLRHLKANPESSETPVVFLTARVDAISQKTGMDIGAVEYLTKPITPDALLECVQTVLASSS